jgi:hypothetical protein
VLRLLDSSGRESVYSSQVKAVIPDGRMKREARVKQEFHRTTPSIEPLAIGIIAVREETACEILETFRGTTPTFERAIAIDAGHNESKGAAIPL